MFKHINISQAKELLKNPLSILVDIRDEISYLDGHIPHAIHLIQDNLPQFLEHTDKQVPVLVICYHGNSSQIVADLLANQGFSDVYSIDGGYEQWMEEELLP